MEQIKIRCRSCKNFTNHSVVVETIEKWEEYCGQTSYQIVECLGCNTKSFRTKTIDGENPVQNDDGEDEPSITETIYPPYIEVISEIRTSRLPEPIRTIFEQTISAINIGNNTLTAIGLRATLEAICKEREIKAKSLDLKINQLQRKGVVTFLERDRLHAVRFLGNDAAHELAFPDRDKLLAALKIIEHILLSLYIMDKDAGWHLDYPLVKEDSWLELVNKKIKILQSGDKVNIHVITPGIFPE